MKKGIALLLTLSFLIIAIGIVSGILLFYKNISSNSFEYSITEDNLIINSVKTKLNSVKIKNKKDLEKLLNGVYILNKKNFGVIVNVTPLNNRLNINQFLQNNKVNGIFDDIFTNVCNIYDIKYCNYLKNLILDTIDQNSLEREDGTEIKNYQPFKNGKIESFNQLNTISNYYYQHTHDKNIFKIKWEKLFNLYGNYLDCNIISKNTAKILNLHSEPINCQTIYDTFSNYFIKKLDIIPFNQKKPFYINIHVVYKFHKTHILNILYDIKTQRIISIEKHFIY